MLDFPAAPAINQIFASGALAWKWDGVKWGGTSGPRQIISVKDYGAYGDGIHDDTAACQSALNAGAGKGILFPAGTYLISSTLAVPPGAVEYMIGEGASVSIIKQTSATAGGISFLNAAGTEFGVSGGGVRGLTIMAGNSVYPAAWNSTGTALKVQVGGNGFSVFDLIILRFATAIDIDSGWNAFYTNILILTVQYGIKYGWDLSYGAAGGSYFTNVIMQDGAIAATTIGSGIEIRQGGSTFTNIGVLGFADGFVIKPAVNKLCFGSRLIDVAADTCAGNGFTFDATNVGSAITALRCETMWAGFNNAAGVVVFGNCTDYQLSGDFRENGSNGIHIAQAVAANATIAGTVNANARGVYSLANAGTGYTAGNILTSTGGTGGPISVVVTNVTGAGAVLPSYEQGWKINTVQAYSVLPTNPISFTGGTGTGFQLNLTGMPNYSAGVALDSGVTNVNVGSLNGGNFSSLSVTQGATLALGSSAENFIFAPQVMTSNPALGLPGIVNASTVGTCTGGTTCKLTGLP